MGFRKCILIVSLTLPGYLAGAQVKTYLQADSLSDALYHSGDWPALITMGKKVIGDSIDFVNLRSRLGYAYFMTANYSAAIHQYHHVYKTDTAGKLAKYYAYLCQTYLNDEPAAFYEAGLMGPEYQKSRGLKAFDLYEAGAETGLKWNSDPYRGTASYSRISLGLRLNWRLVFDQSIAYFGQAVSAPDSAVNIDRRRVTVIPGIVDSRDNEFEYYGKLSYTLAERVTLLAAYHYLQTRYFDDSYYSNLGMLGIKYRGNYFSLQGDADFGHLVGHALTQYNVGLMLYPAGNLNLYTISRFSYLDQDEKSLPIFNQSVGFKALTNTWLETQVTFGKLDNYIDTDGLYIYNSIDVSTFKAGETIFYLLGKHTQLQLNYTFEKKQDSQNGINYNQASVTAGMVWKF